MRQIYIPELKKQGKYPWIDADKLRSPPRPRIHVISDTHEPFKSMADGKIYDSKSSYRADIKARGLQEVGNEKPTIEPFKPAITEGDVARAFAELGHSTID